MMRICIHPSLICVVSVLAIRCCTAQTSLPECALACYESLLSDQTPCLFAKNDCICSSGPIAAAIEACVAQKCTIKERFITKNATETVCERPTRSQSHVLIHVNAILGALALLAMLMRVFVAIRMHSFGLDDLCACLAGCLAFPHFLGSLLIADMGLGKDIWTLAPSAISEILKIVYISQIFYFLTTAFTKLTFLFFFLRIFPLKVVRLWCFIGIGLSVAYVIGFGLTMVFACWPIRATWTSWTKEQSPRYCINQNVFFLTASGVNIGIDVLIGFIPLPHLWRLNLSLKKKLMLIAIFSVGFVTVLMSCLRIGSLTRYSTTHNPIYDTLSSAVWSSIEVNVGVVCICMPSFRRFLSHAWPGCFGTTTQGSTPMHDEAATRLTNGKKSARKRSVLPGHLYDTTIIKTVDTHVSCVGTKPQDDELQLVDMGQNKSVAKSIESVECGPSELGSCEKIQHRRIVPEGW